MACNGCGRTWRRPVVHDDPITALEAIALVEVDQGLTPAILDTVRALPNVIQVKAMSF